MTDARIAHEHFRKLENMYRAGPINALYDPVIEVSAGRAVIEMPVQARHFHSGMSLHGSVYFKGLDDAAYFAVNALVEDSFVFTVSFHVHLVRPVTEGTLRAEGWVTTHTQNMFFASATMTNRGKVVAEGSGTFSRSKIPLESVPSYSQ